MVKWKKVIKRGKLPVKKTWEYNIQHGNYD